MPGSWNPGIIRTMSSEHCLSECKAEERDTALQAVSFLSAQVEFCPDSQSESVTLEGLSCMLWNLGAKEGLLLDPRACMCLRLQSMHA